MSLYIRMVAIFFTVLLIISLSPCLLYSDVIKGTSPADKTPTWYAMDWVLNSKYSPIFEVLDTESALGRYAPMTKTITLKDLIKFHGHPCDGLIQAACALKMAFDKLFPNGVIDRTDIRVLSSNSPCYVDAASYLTGARINFGTLEIDNSLGTSWIVQVISTGKTVKVTRRSGVFPKGLEALEKKIKSGRGTPEEITRCRDMEWKFAKRLLSRPLESSFKVQELKGFHWPGSKYKKVGKRGDIRFKNAPYCNK